MGFPLLPPPTPRRTIPGEPLPAFGEDKRAVVFVAGDGGTLPGHECAVRAAVVVAEGQASVVCDCAEQVTGLNFAAGVDSPQKCAVLMVLESRF